MCITRLWIFGPGQLALNVKEYVRREVVARQHTGVHHDLKKDGALVERDEPSSTARTRRHQRSVRTEPTVVRGRGKSSSERRGGRWSSQRCPARVSSLECSTHVHLENLTRNPCSGILCVALFACFLRGVKKRSRRPLDHTCLYSLLYA